MVWKVKTNQMPNAVQKLLLVVDKGTSRMNESLELLKCNENLPSSPGYASSDEHMELDDLPELQAVQTDSTPPALFQLGADVSHQECSRPSWNQRTSNSNAESAYSCENGVNWLTELANIATSPQSPLMQCSFYNRSSPVHIIATSKSLHSYARPPPGSSKNDPSFSKNDVDETPVRHERANSESESGIFCMSSLSDDDDLGWCHSWPSTVWHCFLKGSRLCFHKGRNKEWQDVEDFARSESCGKDENLPASPYKGYGSDGLKLISHEESISFGESVLKLTFDPGTVEDGLLTVECRLDHPFYVKNKGWSSFYPSLTVVQHGIPCCEMHLGDLCLPPGHPDAINFDDSGVFDTFKSYDFTPMDSSAVYVLSSMARQRRASLSCGGSNSQEAERSECSSKNCASTASSHLSSSSLYSKAGKSHSSGTASTVSATSPNKCKRPMNAFMLFAKKYRVEYTQMYPGKDNRAISVILGDRWKKMKNEERRMYTLEAKALAEEQKRLNPDCWKRKRTNSELRSREEELTRAALQQKSQEELLKRREQQLAEREIDVLERELNIMIFQLNQEKPNVKKRKGKFKRSRLKLKDGHRISLPSDFQHKITVQASPNLDKRRSLNSNSSSPSSSPTIIPRLRAIQLIPKTDTHTTNGRRNSVYVYQQDVDITSECELPSGVMKKVTSDESNRTWGRSTTYHQEEFEDVKRSFKKRGCTWGPSSVQSKDRADCKDKIRPLSDGSNPWSTVLMKNQKGVPLASLFVDQGVCTDKKLLPEGLDSKRPKPIKLPNQAYINLPLWKDDQGENALEHESFEEGTSASSTNSTPQMTPTNSLSRTLQKKKTDSVLYGCAVLLASVALGLDIRELNRPQGPDELLPKDEKKKRDGIFQRASIFRRSASPTRLQTKKEETSNPTQNPAANTVNLLSMPSISTKCLLQPDSEDAFVSTVLDDCGPCSSTDDFSSETSESKREPRIQVAPNTVSTRLKTRPFELCQKEESQNLQNDSLTKLSVFGHRRTLSDGNNFQTTANGFAPTNVDSTLPVLPVTGTLHSPSVQQRSNRSGVSTEKQSAVNIISRPRPSSVRSKIDSWQIIPRIIKPNSKDSECLEGNVDSDVTFLPDTEKRTNCHMPSLLDIDVEGQNRDCTVPLCRMKSKTCRPSIYELEREFLS